MPKAAARQRWPLRPHTRSLSFWGGESLSLSCGHFTYSCLGWLLQTLVVKRLDGVAKFQSGSKKRSKDTHTHTQLCILSSIHNEVPPVPLTFSPLSLCSSCFICQQHAPLLSPAHLVTFYSTFMMSPLQEASRSPVKVQMDVRETQSNSNLEKRQTFNSLPRESPAQ